MIQPQSNRTCGPVHKGYLRITVLNSFTNYTNSTITSLTGLPPTWRSLPQTSFQNNKICTKHFNVENSCDFNRNLSTLFEPGGIPNKLYGIVQLKFFKMDCAALCLLLAFISQWSCSALQIHDEPMKMHLISD